MLTADQVAHWHAEGYCLAPTFFTPAETRALQAELIRLQDEGLLRNVRCDGDGSTQSDEKINLQLCPSSPHSELFRALPFSSKVRDSIKALLGGPNIVQLDQIFLKPAGNGDGTSWHQDNAYFGALDNTMGTGMWIAVHDASEANGTMQLIPRSHRTALEHTRDGFSDHHVRCYPNEDEAVSCNLPAGGVVFFNYGIAHCTGANTTAADRAGLAYHFHHCEIPLGEGHIKNNAGKHQKPRLDGGDNGLTEYGVDLNGVFDQMVTDLQPA